MRAASDNGTAIWIECDQEAGDILCVALRDVGMPMKILTAAGVDKRSTFVSCAVLMILAELVQVRAMRVGSRGAERGRYDWYGSGVQISLHRWDVMKNK